MNLLLEINSLPDYFKKIWEIIIDYSPKLITALIVLFIGLYTIRLINRLVKKIMLERELDPTLSKFLADILLWILRILLFVTFISKLGIETSSFVAILGAAGLAIGLALQGSLSNFAGGILIILFKPFRVGDTIEAHNVIGKVKEIQIFVTKLITINNQTIFIPNGILSNGVIINYSVEGIRRADLVFSFSYETNIKEAKNIVLKVMDTHPKVLKNPTPTIMVKDLTNTSIHIAIQPWIKNEDFAIVCSDLIENCKLAFDEAKISLQPITKEMPK